VTNNKIRDWFKKKKRDGEIFSILQHTSLLMVELYKQILAGKTYSRILPE